MNSRPTVLLLVLALVAGGSALVAWRQHQELAELRGAALGRDERAGLQKRLWDLEKTNRELSDQLAAQRAGQREPGEAAAEGGEATRPGAVVRGRGMNPNNPREAAFRDLLARPEVQAVLTTQQKLQMEQRYAALFRLLNLSPDQAERLKTLLVERQNSPQEVLTVAREQGINPRSDRAAVEKLLADARDAVDVSIKGLIGESGFAQMQTYERTLPQRAVVDQLQQRLSYTSTPLSTNQAEQLVGILAANTPTPTTTSSANRGPALARGGSGEGAMILRGPELGAMAGAFFGGGASAVIEAGLRGPGAPITSAALNQAQGVLSQPQVTALQQIQQQQQQTQQVRQLFNDTMMASRSGANVASPAPPTPRPRG